jgi:hypothetical protein
LKTESVYSRGELEDDIVSFMPLNRRRSMLLAKVDLGRTS